MNEDYLIERIISNFKPTNSEDLWIIKKAIEFNGCPLADPEFPFNGCSGACILNSERACFCLQFNGNIRELLIEVLKNLEIPKRQIREI